MLGVKPGWFRGSTSSSSHDSPPAGPSREASEGSSVKLLSDLSVHLPVISEANLYSALREFRSSIPQCSLYCWRPKRMNENFSWNLSVILGGLQAVESCGGLGLQSLGFECPPKSWSRGDSPWPLYPPHLVSAFSAEASLDQNIPASLSITYTPSNQTTSQTHRDACAGVS